MADKDDIKDDAFSVFNETKSTPTQEDNMKPSTSSSRDELTPTKASASKKRCLSVSVDHDHGDEDSTSSTLSSPPKKVSRKRLISGDRLSESEVTSSPDKLSRVGPEEDGEALLDSSHMMECQSAESKAQEERKMRALISHFGEDELSRFEMYRRATFPKAGMRRLMQSVSSCSISQNLVIAMSGISKVFVGEIIEEALDFKESLKEEGPLQPKHLREAVRRLHKKHLMPHGKPKNPLR